MKLRIVIIISVISLLYLAIPKAQIDTGGSSALIQATTCTSQFLTAIASVTGAGTCASVTDALLSLSDITTNNASTSNHGFVKKLSNVATQYYDGTGNYSVPTGLTCSSTAPTITSGFGSSPSIVNSNGTCAFELLIGTGGVNGSGILALPTAAHGWHCTSDDITTPASNYMNQIGFGTTAATIQNYARTTGIAQAWPAGDHLLISCSYY